MEAILLPFGFVVSPLSLTLLVLIAMASVCLFVTHALCESEVFHRNRLINFMLWSLVPFISTTAALAFAVLAWLPFALILMLAGL